MGGGGGSYYDFSSGKSAEEIQSEKAREAESEVQGRKYRSDVNGFLGEVLARSNDRDADAQAERLERICSAVHRDIEGKVSILFGGSVQKNTYVKGFSDIDGLLLIDNTELQGKSPSEVIAFIKNRLEERYPNSTIIEGGCSVKITLSGDEIQVIPALKTKSGFKICDEETGGWSSVIRPLKFAKALTEANKDSGGLAVPAIKIVKNIISQLPEQKRIKGYHLEAIASDAFRGYSGQKDRMSATKHLISACVNSVQRPIADITGQSAYVDEYLGAVRSVKRRNVADAFTRIQRRMNAADSSASVQAWKELFND
jgi:hypothetical protein